MNMPVQSLLATLDRLGEQSGTRDVLAGGRLSDATVRIRHRRSRIPATTEVDEIVYQKNGTFDVYVNVLNFSGPLGVLPNHSETQTLVDQDHLLHRLVSELYILYQVTRCDSKNRLSHLIPWGVPPDLDEEFIPMAALFVGPRTGPGLAKLLSTYFDVSVHVQAVAGGWEQLDATVQWNSARECKIRIGPMYRVQFEQLLPGERKLGMLLKLARYYLGIHHPVSVELVLRGKDVQFATVLDRGDVFVMSDVMDDSVTILDSSTCWKELNRAKLSAEGEF